MLKIFVSILVSFVLFGSAFCMAEEGERKALMVPDAPEMTKESTLDTEDSATDTEVMEENEAIPSETVESQATEENLQESHEENTQTAQNESAEETSDVAKEEPQTEQPEVQTEESKPSPDVIEAQRAEEAELRELGAGEEPIEE